MIVIQLTEEEKKKVLRERFAHPSPKVQKRMEALHLRSLGKSYSDITTIIGCSRTSVYRWLTIYLEEGIEGLKSIEYNRAEGALEPHRQSLEEYFKNNPPASIREASVRIKERTGVERSERVVREFLRSLGMSYRKTGRVPGKADRQAQEEFKKKSLEPRLEEATQGQREVYFTDASHFVWQGFVGYLWCFVKIWFGSPTGRKRFSVIGALNAITHEVLCICTDGCVSAWTVIDLLWTLRRRFLLTGIPITVVLDNASYQRCYLVQFTARLMGIELLFLPPYSPNLNLIERFWKLVKKKVIATKDYATFEDFCGAIESFTKQAHITHKEELRTLLTLRFQTLPEKTVVAA